MVYAVQMARTSIFKMSSFYFKLKILWSRWASALLLVPWGFPAEAKNSLSNPMRCCEILNQMI
jgi:hypothetical protein